jgi:hypothetical protein
MFSKVYNKYSPLKQLELSFNYLTSMVDDKLNYLPYWLVEIDKNPAYARHCRCDDAEISASWAEALMLIRRVLGKEDKQEVLDGLIEHTLKGFEEDGLHYHSNYPWTPRIFAAMHEQAYIASFLTTWYRETKNNKAQKYMDGLVCALRKLVVERKMVTFWGGDYSQPRKSYFFQGDAIYKGKGWDLTKWRGSGEEGSRNYPMASALMIWYELTGNEEALDLAEGILNYSIYETHYVTYGGKFAGHVHSNLWIAIGLAKLARIKQDVKLAETARNIYLFGRSISSSFGWVPEFANFKHQGHIECESCCIKDMIELAFEMIKLGFDEWDLIDRYARNQLVENQIQDSSFVIVDNNKEDTDLDTFKDLDKRVIGGFTGGSMPNSISLARFRSVAGCCCGIAPQAHIMIYDNIVTPDSNGIKINLPIDIETKEVCFSCDYPNAGKMTFNVKKDNTYKVRMPEWAGNRITARVQDKLIPILWENDYIVFHDLKKGQTVNIEHALFDEVKEETVNSINLTITWRGNHIIKMLPDGAPLQLYKRDKDAVSYEQRNKQYQANNSPRATEQE